MKVKMESEKVGLKLNIQKMKVMESGPITSWEIDEETVETVLEVFFFNNVLFYALRCHVSSYFHKSIHSYHFMANR